MQKYIVDRCQNNPRTRLDFKLFPHAINAPEEQNTVRRHVCMCSAGLCDRDRVGDRFPECDGSFRTQLKYYVPLVSMITLRRGHGREQSPMTHARTRTVVATLLKKTLY